MNIELSEEEITTIRYCYDDAVYDFEKWMKKKDHCAGSFGLITTRKLCALKCQVLWKMLKQINPDFKLFGGSAAWQEYLKEMQENNSIEN